MRPDLVNTRSFDLWKGGKLGPVLRLPPHKSHCELNELHRYAMTLDGPLAIDLFCGAGGLSLGLVNAGFEVILGVDVKKEAIETHRHHFGGASIQADLSRPEAIQQIVHSLEGTKIDLVAGGPPCQPFSAAGKNKIRSLIRDGTWTESDNRTELWQSFVQVVTAVRPKAVLIENVPDMALGEDSMVFRRLVVALEHLGYHIDSKIVPTWQHGVPQHRKRLIVVGMRNGLKFEWPEAQTAQVHVRDAIDDLPKTQGGQYVEAAVYEGPRTSFQTKCREGVPLEQRHLVRDHFTRAVREDDLEAFRLMDSTTRYSDLPESLRRYRADTFKDKYKRLGWDELSRTITAHIAKDGYWYIHPEQHRTLTIREAARLQTFPDHFRFAGAPSLAFRQIGEAVPPELGNVLGTSIRKSIKGSQAQPSTTASFEIADTLRTWLHQQSVSDMAYPWLLSRSLWIIALGFFVFNDLPSKVVSSSWAGLSERWMKPQDYVSDVHRKERLISIGRGNRAQSLFELADTLDPTVPEGFSSKSGIEGIPPSTVAMAMAVSGRSQAVPVTSAPYRLARRIFGQESSKQTRTDGQLLLGRVIGDRTDGRAFAAVLEISARYCKRKSPECRECPLNRICVRGRTVSHRPDSGAFGESLDTLVDTSNGDSHHPDPRR